MFVHENYAEKYVFREEKIKFLLAIDRSQVRAQIHCMSTSNAEGEEEEEEEEESILEWNNLTLNSFELIHGFSRVCKLLPDKLATAIVVNKEELKSTNDSGAFLIELVQDLTRFYTSDRFIRQTPCVTQTIEELNTKLDFLRNFLNGWHTDSATIASKSMVKKIDVFYKACLLYIEFLHPELRAVQRDRNSSKGSELFSKAIDQIMPHSPTLLEDEFHSLLDAAQ